MIFFLTQREKKLGFLGEIFRTQTKDGWSDLTQANLSNKKLTRPVSKIGRRLAHPGYEYKKNGFNIYPLSMYIKKNVPYRT